MDPVGVWFGAFGRSGTISVSFIGTVWSWGGVVRAARHRWSKVGTGFPLKQIWKIGRHQVGFSRQIDQADLIRQATEIRKQISKIDNWT